MSMCFLSLEQILIWSISNFVDIPFFGITMILWILRFVLIFCVPVYHPPSAGISGHFPAPACAFTPVGSGCI